MRPERGHAATYVTRAEMRCDFATRAGACYALCGPNIGAGLKSYDIPYRLSREHKAGCGRHKGNTAYSSPLGGFDGFLKE